MQCATRSHTVLMDRIEKWSTRRCGLVLGRPEKTTSVRTAKLSIDIEYITRCALRFRPTVYFVTEHALTTS